MSQRIVCVQCWTEDSYYRIPHARVWQVYKEKQFAVITPVLCCKNCGHQIFTDGQIDQMAAKTRKYYERRWGSKKTSPQA